MTLLRLSSYRLTVFVVSSVLLCGLAIASYYAHATGQLYVVLPGCQSPQKNGTVRMDLDQPDPITAGHTDAKLDHLLPGFRQIGHVDSLVTSGLPYRYTPPEESGIEITGTEFNVEPSLIHRLGLPPRSYFNLSRDTVTDFHFVTAADHSHYMESVDCVASIQARFPGHMIHYYDIGLTSDQRDNVSSWCDVKLHAFSLDIYPKHVSAITNKCFKYLVIQEALTSHGAVFWVDASFRALHDASRWQDVFDLALNNGGVVMAEYKHDSDVNINWTDPMMFYFLVTDPTKQIWINQLQSGAVLIYNTEWAFTRVLWWMYLCSLEGRCCPRQTYRGPDGVSQIEFRDKVTFKNHCSDQSALNILLSNAHGFNVSRYGAPSIHLTFKRKPTEFYKVKTCMNT